VSAKATFWAWKQFNLGSSKKLVLLCLADCHNANTERCDPSISYISEHTDLNRKTVMKAIESLAESGCISTQKKQGARTNFHLLIDGETSTNLGTSTKSGTSTNLGTPTSTNIGTTPVPNLGHEPITNLQDNLKVIYKRLELTDLPEQIDQEIAQELIDHRINIKKPFTQQSLNRLIKKILKVEADQEVTLTPNQVIEKIIDRGWQGFELDWLKSKEQLANQSTQPKRRNPLPNPRGES